MAFQGHILPGPEYYRLGVRLMRKAWRKLVLGAADVSAAGEEGFHDPAAKAGVPDESLLHFVRHHGIPFHSTRDPIDLEAIAALKSIRPDVVAFTGGGIIRKPLFQAAGRGIIITHMGLLPGYRGMDVAEWPILAGRHQDPGLGVTLHFTDRGIDTGPIVRTERVPTWACPQNG